MIKLVLIILNSFSLFAGFKSERTNKISPLSNTLIEIEKQKKAKGQKINIMKTESAFKTFNKQNSKNGKWKLRTNSYGIPSLLSGDKTKKYYGDIKQISQAFLTENKELLGIDFNNLIPVNESYFLNTKHIEYRQIYKGIPVEFSYVKVHSNLEGEISLYSSRYFPYINLDINPNISIDYAKSIISMELGPISISSYSLVVYPDELKDEYYLAWKIKVDGGNGNLNGKWIYYIDAKSGDKLFRYDSRQYACTLQEETTGYVYAKVYDISPFPTGSGESGPTTWVPKITTPIANQYVFAGNVNTSTITRSNGEYCIDYDPGNNGAKVFMTTMGPYFSVMNFNGKPSFFTNGSFVWRTASTPLSVNSYSNNSETTYTVSPTYSIGASESLAFVGPFFQTLNLGEVDNCGSGIDNDMLYVMDSTGNAITSWFGKNKSNLFGGLIPSSSYKIKVKSDSQNSGNFYLSISSYVVITNYQNANNATGTITWSTSNYINDSNGASINTFYHLNKIREFMMKFNSKCPGTGCINLNKRVPAMVGVFGDATTIDCWQSNTMWNAFYDMEHDAIFMGKGIDEGGYYKDFGLDGTVIRHEYGHLVMNRIYPIIYFGEFGAITEAISDYFALSSFWDENKTLTILGNFIGTGEGAARDLKTLSDNPKKMPDDWVGEVHDDGQILSGALYKIRASTNNDGEDNCNTTTGTHCLYNLGKFTSGTYSGLYKADLYIFGSMFYFPDNFENFLEAIVDLCKQVEGTGCAESKIRAAFGVHGIGAQAVVDKYEPNNGPEYATNISTINNITAYIDYKGDEDYYVLPLKEGAINLRLYLPESSSYPQLYHAYGLFLFDSQRNYIKDISPDPVPSLCYSETVPENCYTRSSYVDLYYPINKTGIYYIAVTGSLNMYYGNGVDYNKTSPYRLTYDAQNLSVVTAEIKNRKVDEDEIEFTAVVPKFEYLSSIPPTNWTNGSEFEFCEYECIKLFDNNLKELSTNYISVSYVVGETSYNTTDSLGRSVIKGKITLKSYGGKTFSQRYPGAGTIYIKIYAKNHMFNVGKTDYIPLGISNPLNLTASKTDFISYNNIITKDNSSMTLKYESTTNSNIKIAVYTPTGQKVKTIYEGAILGKISFNWDGTDDNGSKLASGIYYIKTEGAINKVEKVAIVR
ncbi:MAG: FlgD immunoglobulin-like domain containing protein [Elusimicrobiota bacterium]